ncbi:MAG: Holliday junction resolvase RuvX [Thermomicrobiales bacterium]
MSMDMKVKKPIGRMLGLDMGSVRIGVAISDELGMIASPLKLVLRAGPVVQDVQKLLREYDVARLVVGLPVGMSGREGPQAAEVRSYTESIAGAFDLPLEYWDERMTTSIAHQYLSANKTKRDKRKQQVDAIAAAVMLQSYLDHLRWNAN